MDMHAACLQKTWMLGDTDEELHKYVILNHGPPAKLCKRGSLGVAIVLSPRCASVGQSRERATTLVLHFGLRIIAVRLLIDDRVGEPVKIFLVSAYARGSRVEGRARRIRRPSPTLPQRMWKGRDPRALHQLQSIRQRAQCTR